MNVCIVLNCLGIGKRIENFCFKAALEGTSLVFSLENNAVTVFSCCLLISWNVLHPFLLLSSLILD